MSPKKTVRQENDAVTNKILLVFALAFVGLFLLMTLNRYISRGSTFLTAYRALQWAGGLSGLGAAAGILLMVARRGQEQERVRILSGRNILVVSALVGVGVLFILSYDFLLAIKVLYVAVLSLAVVYLIFCIYPREFFLHTLLCALSAGGMWFFSRALAGGRAGGAIYFIAYLLLVMAAAGFVRRLQANKGMLQKDGSRRLLPDRPGVYGLLYATCGAVALSFLAAFLLGPSCAYYLSFAILGYLLMLAIYFTTSLI